MSNFSGNFIAWRLSNSTTTQFQQWLKETKISKFGQVSLPYHVTVIYSPTTNLEVHSDQTYFPISVTPSQMTWGLLRTQNNAYCLVLKMHFPEIEKRHLQLLKDGLIHSHEIYIPHLTVVYPISSLYIDRIVSLPLPNFNFVFDFEYQNQS